MSYDISLNDPVTGEVAKVPGHLMIGGTYMADYHPETRTVTPALNTYASLNITYNYSGYYYEVFKDKGIRIIYGCTGYDSISMLEKMISCIDNKYKKNGNWIITKRKNTIYYDKNDKEMELTDVVFRKLKVERKEEVVVEVSEGDTSDYWLATAANAIKPLYQLIALAKMRPDCIWSGD